MTRSFTRNFFKLLILLPGLLAFCYSADAQHFNFAATSGTFTPLSGANAIDAIESDDAISGNLNIGFNFNYYGTDYTQFRASSNGFITFDLSSSSNPGNSMGTSGNLLLAPLWDDLGGSGGAASYKLEGTTPNQVLTVEWLNWKWYYGAVGPVISFQVKLYETTNKIEFTYRQEANAPDFASASIGIVGNSASKIYALPNSSSSVILTPTGSNSINVRPATGQIFSFTPSVSLPVAPTTQASGINATAVLAKSLTVNWTGGNGSYRAVFMKQTSATETATVADGTGYLPSTTFGSGSSAGTGWYCVYNGIGSSVAVSGLESGLPYRVQVIEYNGLGGAQKYYTATVTDNPATVSTTLVAPSGSPSAISVSRVSGNEATFSIATGDGTRRAVFMKATTTGTAPVVDNTTYLANTVFGSGTQIGSSGWFCVFNGTASSSVTVTGLSGSTGYRIFVADYNGLPGSERYNTAAAAVQITTHVNVGAMPYTFAASSGTFTPITGATAVDAIEADDSRSDALPIGFSFRFNGQLYTQLYASSNGFLSLNAYADNVVSSTAGNNLLTSGWRSVIAPLWDDLDGAGGQASYVTTGSAPNRVFTFEWLNYQWDYSAASAGISFQAKLYEADGKVEFIYRQEAGALVGPGASIGLAFSNLGTGNIISLNNATASPTASTTAETTNIATKPATGQVYSFTPQKLAQTITFNALSDRFFGTGTFALNATSSSGLPVTYTSSNPAVATISGNTVTLTGVGSVTITAAQAGDANYNAATSVNQAFNVNKGNQTISFATLGSLPFGTAPFNLTGTASSNLAITYTSSNTNVATINGSTITIVAPGTTDITASQAGNGNYNAAADVVRTLTVTKANQTITFNALPTDKKVGDAPFTITATSSSGLPVTFSSANTAIATVSGNTVTIVSNGVVNITASQAGDANYNPATDVVSSLTIKLTQTITFPEVADQLEDTPFTLNATSNSGLTVSYAHTAGTGTLSINGPNLEGIVAGKVTVTASQAGNAAYAPATPVARTFCINPKKPTVQLNVNNPEVPVLSITSQIEYQKQWYKDGVAIPNANGISHNVTAAGVYTVILSTADGCSSVASDPETLVVTGIEEIGHGVKIYPNPVADELMVDVSSLQSKTPVSLMIFDMTGRTKHSVKGNGKILVKMSDYNAGAYLLKVQDNKRIITKHITKK